MSVLTQTNTITSASELFSSFLIPFQGFKMYYYWHHFAYICTTLTSWVLIESEQNSSLFLWLALFSYIHFPSGHCKGGPEARIKAASLWFRTFITFEFLMMRWRVDNLLVKTEKTKHIMYCISGAQRLCNNAKHSFACIKEQIPSLVHLFVMFQTYTFRRSLRSSKYTDNIPYLQFFYALWIIFAKLTLRIDASLLQ